MRWNIFIIEIIIILTFWITIHYSCESIVYQPKTNKVYFDKHKDKDDTIPPLNSLVFEQKDIDTGCIIFKRNCAACHSFNREGPGPVMDTNISFKHFDESVSDINELSKRYEHTANLIKKYQYVMPKFNEILTNEEIHMVKIYTIYEMQTRCGK